MNILKRLKFIKKIMILPVMALIALTIILLIPIYLGSMNNNLLNRIETGNYPALEMKHDIYEEICTNITLSI